MTRYATPPILPSRYGDRIITPWSEEAIGGFLRAINADPSTTDRAWTANLAMFVPFHIEEAGLTVKEAWVYCGSGSGNNLDIGVYDLAGNRLTSSGATARATSATAYTTTLADTPLPIGDYYMAIAGDSTSNFGGPAPGIGLLEAAGVCEMAAAYVLPSTATLARNLTQAAIPFFGLTLRAVGP